MLTQTTPLAGLLVVSLDIFKDERGFFVERFNSAKFKEHGLPDNFCQVNHSRSYPKVIRGLHCQHTPPQGKLVGVTKGAIWDVAVDIRPNSSTLGQYFAIELSAENGKLLWVPAGFAHGFCVLGNEEVDVIYNTTALFVPGGESGIKWNDPDLNINWPIENPIISQRDQNMQSFKEYLKNPPKWD